MANRKLQEIFGVSASPQDNTASRFHIQKVFQSSYAAFCESGAAQSRVQEKAARALIRCKSGSLTVMSASVGTAAMLRSIIIPAATGTVQTARQS